MKKRTLFLFILLLIITTLIFFAVFSNRTEFHVTTLSDGTVKLEKVENFKGNTLTIPDGVNIIGEYALSDLDAVSISIPQSVVKIEEGAFSGCHLLTSIQIPDSVTEIGRSAFAATGLRDIPYMGGITHLPSKIFSYCNNMISINIPEGIESIDHAAFSDCNKLEHVSFPSTLQNIAGWDSFFYCFNINTFNLSPDNPNYYVTGNCVVDRRTNTVIDAANLSTIPDGVTSIGEASFAMLDNLTTVSIPNTVKTIELWAFVDSKNLRYIYIPETVENISGKIVGGNSGELHIYCEAKMQPNSWNEKWNADNYPVIWGCSREEFEQICSQ